jgi:hypothetical protein
VLVKHGHIIRDVCLHYGAESNWKKVIADTYYDWLDASPEQTRTLLLISSRLDVADYHNGVSNQVAHLLCK